MTAFCGLDGLISLRQLIERKDFEMYERLICAIADRSSGFDEDPVSDPLDYRQLGPVSKQLMASYAKVAELGLPPHAVALAMLGATVNLFDAYGLGEQLPELLRATADLIEYPGQLS